MTQSHLPPQLDACDPQFLPHLMAWPMETKAEIDAVAATKRTIADSGPITCGSGSRPQGKNGSADEVFCK